MLKIRSELEKKILSYFFTNPKKSVYINELASILDADPGNLFRKLKEIENKKWLVSERKGKEKYYTLNMKFPLLKEIKKIFESEHGFTFRLKKALEKLKGLDEAYIYGSYVGGKMAAESDIDILLIGDHSAMEAGALIRPLEKNIGREINIIDMTKEEIKLRKRKKDEFIKDIFNNPLIRIK